MGGSLEKQRERRREEGKTKGGRKLKREVRIQNMEANSITERTYM
jgi:hypothetical protein